jgi:hypothetical protein
MMNFFKISFPYSQPFEFFLILELTSQFPLKLGRVFSRKLETFNGKRNFILKTKIFLKTVTFFVKSVFYPSVRDYFECSIPRGRLFHKLKISEATKGKHFSDSQNLTERRALKRR